MVNDATADLLDRWRNFTRQPAEGVESRWRVQVGEMERDVAPAHQQNIVLRQ
jgi:hypothetical protein